MTAAQLVGLIAAVASVITAATALVKQLQQGRTIASHAQRLGNLEQGPPPPPSLP